jgi:hypothetical protein
VTMSDWEKLYQAAILETDWSKIEERIEAADFALDARLQELSTNRGVTPEEKQRIEDASSGLSALRHEVVTWRSKVAG